jgi:hypothetical protein
LYGQQIDRERSRSRGGFAAIRDVAICMVSKLIANVRRVAGVARQFARSRGNKGVQKDPGAFIGEPSF